MSCLGCFFPNYTKRSIQRAPPDRTKVNPLLHTHLPTNMKELEKMEIDIAERMSKANQRANHATKKMQELLESGALAQANHHLRIRISATKEIQSLSEQIMGVIHWRNQILDAETRE